MAQRVVIPSQEQWRRVGKWCLRIGTEFLTTVLVFVRVSLFVVTGLIFVLSTALLISIIQFQIRIIEAKTQNRGFSLISLTQSVEMQKEAKRLIKTIQSQGSVMSEFAQFQGVYGPKIEGVAAALCRLHTDPELHTKCVTGLFSALLLAAPATTYIIQTYTGQDFDQLSDPLKNTAKDAIELTKERVKFQEEHGKSFAQVRFACSAIGSYSQVFAINFAKGYLDTAVVPCLAAGTSTSEPVQPAPKADIDDLAGGALFFDLVAYYSFYESLFNDIHHLSCVLFPRQICRSIPFSNSTDNDATARRAFGETVVEKIVSAPIDITFIALVIICGALGAMLRITAEMYKPELFGKEVEERGKTSWVYYFIVGVMCSLIVYILAKTVFAGLADSTNVSKSGNMSPFVTAFLAVVSGLLCDEAFQRIVSAGRATLTQSTGDQKDDK